MLLKTAENDGIRVNSKLTGVLRSVWWGGGRVLCKTQISNLSKTKIISVNKDNQDYYINIQLSCIGCIRK